MLIAGVIAGLLGDRLGASFTLAAVTEHRICSFLGEAWLTCIRSVVRLSLPALAGPLWASRGAGTYSARWLQRRIDGRFTGRPPWIPAGEMVGRRAHHWQEFFLGML